MPPRKRVVSPESRPITTPPPTQLADAGTLAEYEIDGNTFLLSAADAKARGAKAVSRPENKAVTPDNK